VTMKEIIEEVASLPVDERAMVADSILRSLNAPDPEIDAKWAQVAQRRLAELRTGAVESVPPILGTWDMAWWRYVYPKRCRMKKKTFDAVAFMRKRREELSRAYAGLSAGQIKERISEALKNDPLWRLRPDE